MNCLKNLPLCRSSCCRSMGFTFTELSKEKEEYLIRHGCKVIGMVGNKFLVHVPILCSALTEENLCKLHGTSKKPQVCVRLDETTYKNYVITSNCLLKGKEGAREVD